MRLQTLSRGVRWTSAALVAPLLAGCAGTSASLEPWQSPAGIFPASFSRPGIADAPLTRILAGTWHDSSSCPSLQVRPGSGSPDTSAGTLFVSEYKGSPAPIQEFDASGLNTTPIGSMTGFANGPWGLSVDQGGTLYVANFKSNNVLEYLQGTTTPSVTLTDQIIFPIDTGTDNDGNLYVVNGYGGPILVFPPGVQSPSETIGGFFYPTQIAFDKAFNMYVVDELYGTKPPLGAVLKFAPGSTKGTNLGLQKLDYPVGIAIDKLGDIAVSNLGSNTVTEYAPGKKTPRRTITDGVCSPVFLAFNTAGELFVANNNTPPAGNVIGYKLTVHAPSVTLTKDMDDPRGLAVNPNWQP